MARHKGRVGERPGGGGRCFHFSCTRVTLATKRRCHPVRLRVTENVECLFREMGGRWGGLCPHMGGWGLLWAAPLLSEGLQSLFPQQPLALGTSPKGRRCHLTSTCPLCSESLS